ncbi:mRNA turnover and ribosome assembly protein [Vermiconidia calcicola]|uniref:mRNA turnover and ribosome assembly protein n=1 Tax=Vermiconidia calcicola TaxID=1690605 RepID=A0ACC3MFF8_9PEZI|nr:mRNA turnover and ribosome assembly protein [Vermiconidia calcicola]
MTQTFPTLQGKRILLLIAHPDDEAMFFAPTLRRLSQKQLQNQILILCLSSGDADGLGHIRKDELKKSALQLGITHPDHVVVIEDEKFPDSMTVTWDAKLIGNMLARYFAPNIANASTNSAPSASLDAIITFDAGGVSGHPNHISLLHGATAFLKTLMHRHTGWECPVKLYTLTTTNVARKYSSVIDSVVTVVTCVWRTKEKGAFPTPLIAKPSKEKSASLYAAVRAAVDTYSHIFVFSVENMRNTYLKNVRQEFNNDGRLFFGKTKVMAKALGLSEEHEHMPGLSKLSEHLKGNVGILCADRAPEEVLRFFEQFMEVDFARAGVEAARSFTVPEGVVYSTGGEQPVEDDVPLPHSLEATVRKWGMPTRLDKGKVMLDQEYVVCKEGQVLDSNQTALLKMFGIAMAEFKVKIVAYWSAATQEVTVVEEAAAEDVDAVLDDEVDGMEEG